MELVSLLLATSLSLLAASLLLLLAVYDKSKEQWNCSELSIRGKKLS